MGLIIAAGNTKPVFPYDYYYGVKINTTVADPAVERVGRPELHQSLPIQSRMRRCILKDDGTVAYYLHPTDSTKTETGAPARLDGTDGMYMVEIPEHYAKFEFDGVNILALISEYPLPGFHKVRKLYRSAVEATVDRTNPDLPKLAAVCNTAAAFRGGNNTAKWDGTYRSCLGMPCSGISLINSRLYARNRGTAGLNGAGWNCDLYEAQRAVYWLFVIEYATRNSQAAFNPQPDANGYKQGGLGPGITTLIDSKWNAYSNYSPVVPCGITNSLGNATGVVNFTMPDEYNPGETTVVSVPSYRGIENPFGHSWKWADGCLALIQADNDGGRSIFYTCGNPANFGNDVSCLANYQERGELPREKLGFIRNLLIGPFGENVPSAIGASSSTYFCDNFETTVTAQTTLRAIHFGGYASYGNSCGLTFSGTGSVAANSNTSGARLCFIPEE